MKNILILLVGIFSLIFTSCATTTISEDNVLKTVDDDVGVEFNGLLETVSDSYLTEENKEVLLLLTDVDTQEELLPPLKKSVKQLLTSCNDLYENVNKTAEIYNKSRDKLRQIL